MGDASGSGSGGSLEEDASSGTPAKLLRLSVGGGSSSCPAGGLKEGWSGVTAVGSGSVAASSSTASTASATAAEEDFSQPDELRDFAFRVEGRVLYLNATYLAIMSPVFQVMTQGGFREAALKEAELKEKSYEDVLELFRCIYPHPITKPIDDKNVDLLLEMSREYQIPDLKQRCSDFLREKFEKIRESPARALELLIIAAKYDMSSLVGSAVPSVAQLSMETLDRHAADGSLPVVVAASIYRAKAYKYRDRVRPMVGPPHHVMGDRKYIVQGASRRKCDSCRVAGSSKSMDRCSRCERHLCEACRAENCDRNVYNSCATCGDECKFHGEDLDSCRCGLSAAATEFLSLPK